MKHLIRNNQIIQSGIPSNFTRDNGEGFWGGYQNRTDIHYEDGWRDEVIPGYNPVLEYLGAPYFDSSADVVRYEVMDLVIDLDLEKENLKEELALLRTEMANLIVQCRLNNDPEPGRLTQLIGMIRLMYSSAKQEINDLTIGTAPTYVLRSAKYDQLLNLLKTFL